MTTIYVKWSGIHKFTQICLYWEFALNRMILFIVFVVHSMHLSVSAWLEIPLNVARGQHHGEHHNYVRINILFLIPLNELYVKSVFSDSSWVQSKKTFMFSHLIKVIERSMCVSYKKIFFYCSLMRYTYLCIYTLDYSSL